MTETSRHPLRTPFGLLMVGQLVSTLGDALAGMALAWLIMELTHSPMARGISLALSSLPMLLLSPLAGAVVDRHRRRSILATSDCLRFLIDLVFAVVIMLDLVQVWHIYLFAVLRSAATIFYEPALSALTQLLIAPDQLVKANGLVQLVRNSTMVVGPILAGLAIRSLGIGVVVLVDGLTFLFSASILAVLRVPQDAVAVQKRVPAWRQLAEGWAYVRAHGWIAWLTGSFVLVNASNSIINVLLPFFAVDTLGLGSGGYGLLTSVRAAGAVCASLLLTSVTLPWRRKSILTLAMLAGAIAVALLGLLSGLAPALLLLSLAGAMGPFMASTSNAMYQSVIPKEFIGRVGVFRHIVSMSMMPVFFFLTGWLTSRLGYVACILIAAGLQTASSLIVHFKIELPEATPIRQRAVASSAP